jgi:precorrin-3B synthase
MRIHLSGCAKGCALASPCALTVVGTANGCGIVRNGTARDTPERVVDQALLADAIARMAGAPLEPLRG